MKRFSEWLETEHPEYIMDEGVLDTIGKSKFLRGAVTAAGLAAGAMRGMPSASADGVRVAPGVTEYEGDEGLRAVDQATKAGHAAAERGDLDVEQMHMVRTGPENWMVTNPSKAPNWYKPYLYSWYWVQIHKVEKTKGRVGGAVADTSWIDKATRGDTRDWPAHTALVDGREVQVDDPLKNPDELLTRISDGYRRSLVRFYTSKIDELGERVGQKAYEMGLMMR